MRSILFRICYWVFSIFFGITSLPLLLIPWRKPLMLWILLYTRVMTWCMHYIAGIKISVTGHEHLPDGPCIIAAKHQSWGDGFVMFSQFYDLAFVTGDHLEKFPLLGGILHKMGAIVVDNCGGAKSRSALMSDAMIKARKEGRRILIYPEGHLSAIGERHRYRKGVWHMYRQFDCPVIPVATNLGLFWPQQSTKLNPGHAKIEFLEPIAPGLDKQDFMERLEHVIETRSLSLLPKEIRPAEALLRRD